MLKVIRATLSEAIQLAGDMNRSWNANADTEMWLDDQMVLHIRRRGVYFATRSYVGAWYEPAAVARPVKKTKAEPVEAQ